MDLNRRKSVLVYDIGGSHVSAAVCRQSDESYVLGPVLVAPHPPQSTSAAFLDLLYFLGTKAGEGCGELVGAQLAVPDPFDFRAGISLMRHKLPYLFGVDLREALAQRFAWHGDQLNFIHDSAAFLLGELSVGFACNTLRAVGVTLGTGLGSAFSLDGELITEGHGIPSGGQIWHLPYQGGIVEDFLSSRGIEILFLRKTGLQRSVIQIAEAAGENTAAADTFVEFGRSLGRILREVLAPFAPETVVLGGGISGAAPLFLPAAQVELQQTGIRLCACERPAEAPLVGAAIAWFNNISSGASGFNEQKIRADAD